MRNPVDRLVSWLSPQLGVRRAQARRALAYYEAAKPDRLRKNRRENLSGDAAVRRAGPVLRELARHLEQNHDVVRGALSILVANTVGPNGIAIEPQPRLADGEIHADLAKQILKLWRDWSKKPEVTWCHDWPSAQRLLARSWFRDGEVFAQRITGSVPLLQHGTTVPYSIEMLEADFAPYFYETDTITQAVERNSWGRPTGYYIYKFHPGDSWRLVSTTDLKYIPADRMLHAKFIDRVRQARGVSVFASVLGRLDDIKDYEESERIAAKVAASMAAYIKKGAPDQYPEDPSGDPRDLKFRPGMIFDDLMPGEEIGMIDSSRPNVNLDLFINGQLRRTAAGIGTTYSSLAKNYDGTYSAQRQELVEGWGAYQILAAEFTHQVVRPVYEDFLNAAVLSGALKLPRDLDQTTLDDALYVAPQMPWIDPAKEANAWVTLESAGYASGPEIIRRRGQNPNDVLEQEAKWQEQVKEKNLHFEPMLSPIPTDQPGNLNNAKGKHRA